VMFFQSATSVSLEHLLMEAKRIASSRESRLTGSKEDKETDAAGNGA